jgi:hypothetical protein
MRHILLPRPIAMGPYRMSQAPAAARLVAPTGGTLGVISGLLRTAAGTIDLTAVAAAANKHLRSTTDTHEQPGRHLHRRGLAHAWTTITMLGIMPRHACSARCGARRRSGTWRFRSASCLPIRQVVNAQLCARSTSSHLRRTPTCGYVDNASALPTDPQDQKTQVSVNLIALEAEHSNPVRHNPDRQPGQPRHPSPHSVSILAAIHTGRSASDGAPSSVSDDEAVDGIINARCLEATANWNAPPFWGARSRLACGAALN